MNVDRLRELLESYGASSDRWPPGERSAAEALIASSAEARTLVENAQTLDDMLNLDLPDLGSERLDRIRSGILSGIAESKPDWAEALLAWLLPEDFSFSNLWRPVLAAGMPLVAGVLLGMAFPSTSSMTADEEISLLGLTDVTDMEWLNE